MSGGGAGSWLEELEARLDSTLEAFLRANPEQEARLREQGDRDRLQQLSQRRLELQGQAELQRRRLIELAGEIRRWQERVEKARGAGADDLAARAEKHIATLMDQGRRRWQDLGELGRRFEAVEKELVEMPRRPPPTGGPTTATTPAVAPSPLQTLESDWAAFEARLELQDLKRRLGQ
jgi:hercynine metabolism protein